MDIRISNNFPYKAVARKERQLRGINERKADSIEISVKNKPLSFKKNFFSSLFYLKDEEIPKYKEAGPPSDFAIELHKNAEKTTMKKIPAENFTGIMSPDEFRELLPSLKEENFISSKKNRKSGVYYVDLDYRSSYTGGEQNIFNILDDVAVYADKYYNETGKKFIFALTDRDFIRSLQHMVEVIGSNPEKYKNVKFLPAIKLSFAQKTPSSELGYETSEIIAYGVNPYSDNLIDFVQNTIQKIEKRVLELLNQLYPEFAYNIIEDFDNTKFGSIENAAVLLNSYLTTGEFFAKYSIPFDESKGKVFSVPENSYEDIIKCLSREPQKPVIALSAPFYLANYFDGTPSKTFEEVVSYVKKLQENSNGMLIAFESVAPMYESDANLTPEIIKNFNDYMRKNTNLYEVGGSFKKLVSPSSRQIIC